jgi:hypothetical protein
MEAKINWIIKANQALDFVYAEMGIETNPTRLCRLIHMSDRLVLMINYAVKNTYGN